MQNEKQTWNSESAPLKALRPHEMNRLCKNAILGQFGSEKRQIEVWIDKLVKF